MVAGHFNTFAVLELQMELLDGWVVCLLALHVVSQVTLYFICLNEEVEVDHSEFWIYIFESLVDDGW